MCPPEVRQLDQGGVGAHGRQRNSSKLHPVSVISCSLHHCGTIQWAKNSNCLANVEGNRFLSTALGMPLPWLHFIIKHFQ